MGDTHLNADQAVRLVCPVDRTALVPAGRASLLCERDHQYPIVDGIPVLLVRDRLPTIGVAELSWKRACGEIQGDARAPELYLETLGISDAEKSRLVELWKGGTSVIDPAVQMLVGATCGIAYKDAIGLLHEYPIPHLPVPNGDGRFLLDIGCNWGRWSIAGAKKGYRVIGLDPQLGAVMAARRVARQLGQEVAFVCADARYLPFPAGAIDVAFSYSVLQHFSREDCTTVLREVGRVLKRGGVSMIQMANALGVRSTYHLVRRQFQEPKMFSVRYYKPGDLLDLFEKNIGKTRLIADCYLGLGLQESDKNLVSRLARAAIFVSEVTKKVSVAFPPLRLLADSVYLESIKP